MKNYKRTLLAASLVTLLPAVVGLALWQRLPRQMAVHWDPQGVGYAGRLFAVLAPPLLSLACLWLCVWLTARSRRAAAQNPRLLRAAVWCIPLISLFGSGLVYAAAFEKLSALSLLAVLPMALLMLLVGNYLPKSQPNPIIGFRVKWTEDPQNWAATHRWGGRLWVGLGALMLFCGFLPAAAATGCMLALLTIGCILPLIYSYRYYKANPPGAGAAGAENTAGDNADAVAGPGAGTAASDGAAVHAQKSAGTAAPPQNKKRRRWPAVLGVCLAAALLAVLAGLLLGGDIRMEYGPESFCVHASFWPDLTVRYDEVESVELRSDAVPGERTWGLESLRLLLGSFSNQEFGSYTRFTYADSSCFVVLRTRGQTLVLAGQTEEASLDIYRQLLARCAS